MSKTIKIFFQKNPLLARYAELGLINITSLAEHIEKTNPSSEKKSSIASIAMTIRRYLANLPKNTSIQHLSLELPLNFVVRSNLQEVIFTKSDKRRDLVQEIFQQLSNQNGFSCLIEGEKEVVLLTNYPLGEILKEIPIKEQLIRYTHDLGFISIDLPISLREVVGVYSHITSVLAVADISIHSFHTIGGEILILVKNEDLVKTQEILRNSLDFST
jgi:hypothetical protein